MPRNTPQKAYRSTAIAIALGLCTLLFNLLGSQISNGTGWLNLGNVFTLMASLALGPVHSLIAIGCGIVPTTLLSGEYLEGVRLIFLCTLLGLISEKAPKFNIQLIAVGVWLFIFGPLLINSAYNWNYDRAILGGLSDSLITALASTILLVPSIWCAITGHARYVNTVTALSSIATSVVLLCMVALLFITGSIETNGLELSFNYAVNTDFLIVGLVLSSILPPLLTEPALTFILDITNGSLQGEILQRRASSSFSGASSERWRREQILVDSGTEIRRVDENPVNKSPNMIPDGQGIIAIRTDGSVGFINRTFRKLAIIGDREVLGKSINNIGLSPELTASISELVDFTKRMGGKILECKIQNPATNNVQYLSLSSQLANENTASSIGDPGGIIITVNDISERRTVEAHLIKAQKLESLGSLVKTIAHDFNNSLMTISGLASVASCSNSIESAKDQIKEILQVTRNAGKVVHELLEFADDKPLKLKTINVSKFLNDKKDFFGKFIGNDFQIRITDDNRPLGAAIDENLLVQAISNLLLNAKEACKSPSTIDISTEIETIDESVSRIIIGAMPGEYARIRIQDYGEGMTKDVLALAFNPLYSTRGPTGRIGLGLSMVYASIKSHDGFLTLESTPEKGTTASIYLPLKDLNSDLSSLNGDSSSFKRPVLPLEGNQEKILVVEDEESIRELLVSMLSGLGYKVSSCCDGAEALAISEGVNTFDLVLVDLMMPKMKGAEFITELRKKGGDVRTLLMTGYGSAAPHKELKTNVLYKPFDLETLAKAIRMTLENTDTMVTPSGVVHSVESGVFSMN